MLCVLTAGPDEPVTISEAAINDPERPFRITRKAQELAERHHLDVSSLGLTGIIKESDVARLLQAQPMTTEVTARKQERLQVPPGGGEAVVVYGASGHARVLIDLMRLAGELFPVAAVDDGPSGEQVLGVPVIGSSSMLPQLKADGIERAVLGIGSVQQSQSTGKALRPAGRSGIQCP